MHRAVTKLGLCIKLAVLTAIVGTAVLIGASSAEAAPSNCRTSVYTYHGMAVCDSGTGSYRATVTCEGGG